MGERFRGRVESEQTSPDSKLQWIPTTTSATRTSLYHEQVILSHSLMIHLVCPIFSHTYTHIDTSTTQREQYQCLVCGKVAEKSSETLALALPFPSMPPSLSIPTTPNSLANLVQSSLNQHRHLQAWCDPCQANQV